MRATLQPLTILVAALGGEGGGVLAEWLVDAATRAGYPAQSTSIPGVAQRTGATTYYIEIFPQARAELQGREPVFGLYPIPGGIDLLVASELLEAGRAVLAGFVSPDRTTLVTSLARALTTQEKMALGDGRFDPDKLMGVAREHSRKLVAFDMERVARDAGTMVSAVLYGAIAATGLLPFPRAVFEEVVRASGVGVEASLRGFAGAFSRVAAEHTPGAPAPRQLAPLPSVVASEFPAATHAILGAGYARLVEFQDLAYADLYVARLRSILGAERRIDPTAVHTYATTREAARFLALWMAFDDVVRVASLKCRASRFARVRREVAGGDDDIVRIVDYFKPGMPELAGLLPPGPARRLIAWDRARQARGKPPFALALRVRADAIGGFVVLRLLAALRRARRRGSRYAEEQIQIERWLAAVERGTRADWRLGHELALCGRLIKGYGETNERGKRNLAHIVDHLAEKAGADAAARAEAIREAREAALADEAGSALDATLSRYGAPPRPIVARPIIWARKRRSAPARGVAS
jgi:indolepyruvate ferredoxin oxidoreductase beta subunit